VVRGGRARGDRVGGVAPAGGSLTFALETVVVTSHIATAVVFAGGGLFVGFKLGQRSRARPMRHVVALHIWAGAETPPPAPPDPDGTGRP
jgi:hypothetical protein